MTDLLAALATGGGLDTVREALARPTATAPGARLLSTRAGDVELRVPKRREGRAWRLSSGAGCPAAWVGGGRWPHPLG